MKQLLMISISLFLFTFATNVTKAQSSDKYETVSLECDMDCGNCASKVKTQLAYTSGVKDVKPDFVKDVVKVTYKKNKTNVEDLISSLDEIGYKAKEMKDGKDCSGKSKADCKSKKPCSTPCGKK